MRICDALTKYAAEKRSKCFVLCWQIPSTLNEIVSAGMRFRTIADSFRTAPPSILLVASPQRKHRK